MNAKLRKKSANMVISHLKVLDMHKNCSKSFYNYMQLRKIIFNSAVALRTRFFYTTHSSFYSYSSSVVLALLNFLVRYQFDELIFNFILPYYIDHPQCRCQFILVDAAALTRKCTKKTIQLSTTTSMRQI